MHFDDRHLDRFQRVMQRDGGMGVSAGIEHDAGRGGARLLNPIDKLTFMVGLPELDGKPKRTRTRVDHGLNVRQGRMPVDFRLPLTQKVQVGAIQNEDWLGHWDGLKGWSICAVLIATPVRGRKLPDDRWLVGQGCAISLTNRTDLDTGIAQTMRIQLNGQDHPLPGPMTLATFVERLGLDTRKIAVERNLEIVPRSTYAATILTEGDRLEIVNFVGGG